MDTHDLPISAPGADLADLRRRSSIRYDLDRLRYRVQQLIRIIKKPLDDVIRDEALIHLPVRVLLRLRSVSSSWSALISSPIFALNHSLTPRSPSGFFSSSRLAFSPFDADTDSIPDPSLSFLPFPQIAPKSSSNGLLLLLCLEPHHYVICNPATEAWTPLPNSDADHGPKSNPVLVFNPSAVNCGSDYFVVVALEIGEAGSGVFGFDVFSSASGTWRASADICYAEEIVSGSGISAGDVACWRTSMQTVLIFDPAVDAARVVEWPLGYDQHVAWELASVEGGRLCCVAVQQGFCVSVFTLLRTDDGDYSWGPQQNCLASVGDCMWMWVKDGAVDEQSETLKGELRPLRSQSGNPDVVLVADSVVFVLDLARRRVRHRRSVPPEEGLHPETDLVVHANTLASVYPQAESELDEDLVA